MAEYRSGNYTAAEEALLAAAGAGKENIHISGTSAFYHAMSLFRQGKEVEARRIATEAASGMKPLPADENSPLTGGANHDDLIIWIAFKEAKGLLKLETAPASPANVHRAITDESRATANAGRPASAARQGSERAVRWRGARPGLAVSPWVSLLPSRFSWHP